MKDKYTPLQHVRPNQIELSWYGLGDAYKSGFGSGISMPKEESYEMEDGHGRFHARHWIWCEEHHSKSSNNRELINLVEVVEEEVEASRMEGLELFFLTENSVNEVVYYQGNSNDKDIFELMPLLLYLDLGGA